MAGRRAGDPMSIVASASRIRERLHWTPEFEDIDTIVAHALAWERRLAASNERGAREAISG